MRRSLLIAAALFSAVATHPMAAYAQSQGGGPGGGGPGGGGDEEEAKAKKKRDEAWSDNQAPLPALRNAGPCPYVKVLYDAGRTVEFKDNKEASANVGYSGEIQGVSAGCQYKGADPITVKMEILFELGKGPQAQGSSKTYRYWIAVTERNKAVITKQFFDLPVNFGAGQDRIYATEDIDQIVIPRATMTTSGSNFEILVGFDVTPEMAAFNREGKRFRLNAGTATPTP
jgi:hypothetical protein